MYANIIIDISHEKVDKPFQYKIPEALDSEIQVGVQVRIPFGKGNHERKGYVVGVTEKADFDPARIKEITGVVTGSVTAESKLIGLAWWMKGRYGSTMNQALKTVLPVKQKVRPKENRCLVCQLHGPDLKNAILEAGKKGYKARERLLKAFEDTPVIPYSVAAGQMNLTMASIKPLIEKQMITLESETVYRNPKIYGSLQKPAVKLNSRQAAIVSDFALRYEQGIRETSLLYGVTGSGKTEVYLEMIDLVLKQGKQVIVLIPEIALTYQTVLRFYRRFGSLVSIINSRMSAGERYDQFERAKRAEVRIMIGPRSALFTPFPSLGLLIIDEEHESAYKSELSPRYHARETAQKLAEMNHATLVLGSATPSLEAYTRALKGEYRLYRLTERAKKDSHMAQVQVVDLREELKNGNRSIFSEALQNAMKERLDKGQQIMLFLNRRGYSSFVSCRSCGEAVRCPHCDVTLTLHHKNRMKCHYCGYEIPLPDRCPACGSPYIAGFGTGTQKIETMTKNMFPQARVLRMDLDTTSKKGGHEEILSAFGEKEADILVGTQMIVKGHDFPNVTLVGVLAADLSLYSSDFRCGERTFQLLTQAAGRAGRGETAGQVIIQTYSPDHYSITCAAGQDYESFYYKEMAYRQTLKYPPVSQLLAVLMSGKDEAILNQAAQQLHRQVLSSVWKGDVEVIGPAEASVYKVNDIYRKILYLKQENYGILINIKDKLEIFSRGAPWFSHVIIQYDFA
ncbi:MAG: primosomal protein N' [Hungatella sp.]|nr:primosomal protein N' [Hungatella sp.]